MAFSLEYDWEDNQVRVIAEGNNSYLDLIEQFEVIISHSSWTLTSDIILDLSRITDFHLTQHGLNSLTYWQEEHIKQFGRGRFAVIAPRDLIYGMFRMWSAFLEGKTEMHVKICRRVEDIEEWFSLQS